MARQTCYLANEVNITGQMSAGSAGYQLSALFCWSHIYTGWYIQITLIRNRQVKVSLLEDICL